MIWAIIIIGLIYLYSTYKVEEPKVAGYVEPEAPMYAPPPPTPAEKAPEVSLTPRGNGGSLINGQADSTFSDVLQTY